MKSFHIDGQELFADDEFKKFFQVDSHPQPYAVSFKPFQNSFSDTDVVLVDENVQRLYGVNHDKMIVVSDQNQGQRSEGDKHVQGTHCVKATPSCLLFHDLTPWRSKWTCLGRTWCARVKRKAQSRLSVRHFLHSVAIP